MSLSTRNFYFISGNPHYGNLNNVRKGVIEFYEDIRLDRALTCGIESQQQQQQQIPTIPSSEGFNSSLAPCSMSSTSQILHCIISVPAFMIHEVRLLEVVILSLSHDPLHLGNLKISFLNHSFREIDLNPSTLL